MDDGWREETAYSCAGLVIVGTILGVMLLCVLLTVLSSGILIGTKAIVSAPTATRVAGYTAATIGQQPDAFLLYPGADLFSTFAAEDSHGLAKPWYASAGVRAGTQASLPDVIAWYDWQLQASGWTSVPQSPIGLTSPVQRWRRGDLTFQISLIGPQYATGWPQGYLPFSPRNLPRHIKGGIFVTT